MALNRGLSSRSSRERRQERRKGLQDPMLGLAWTNLLGFSNSPIVTADEFPDRTRPVALGCQVHVKGAAATGVVWEFGSATSGAKVVIDGGNLYVAAGNGAAATATGVDGVHADARLKAAGNVLRVTMALIPDLGLAQVWVDSELVLRLATPGEVPFLNGEWADSGNGAVGAAAVGTISQRNAPTVTGAPVDFEVSEQFKAAMGQIPRQFDR